MGKVSDKLWEAEAKLPTPIKKHTDKAIRLGTRVAKKLHPFREDTRRKGEAWLSSQKKKLGIRR